jgi:Domain of unknown function (DUF4442)
MNKLMKRHLRTLMNWWPPFLASGIRVTRLDPDWRHIDVELRLHWWNANYVGSHYGGSLYSMTDPFFMLMLIENLGREYIVWDKAATIRFRRAVKEPVKASFAVSDVQLDEIRTALRTQEKIEPTFKVEVRDRDGNVIAEVEKLLYIRRK